MGYFRGEIMEEITFNEEGIKFKYLSNWREQAKESVGPNCIKALVKVVEGKPSTITVYKNDAGDAKAVAQLEEPFNESFKSQGWNIVKSAILNLNGNPVFNIVSDAQEGDTILENNTSAIINNGKMYVFELMHFKDFPYAYNDYLSIMDSLEFVNEEEIEETEEESEE
ncbi:hypothetical protein mru_0732 [Methanobrevibacter ruminantium M1]|uniref:Uncharacterized protein n=2 Tax=Methanobrevibacter ruminantium TaxID=83816 RepID=D3E222_METRM|nr:hypothetical protein mru_0732 [Methanobrevibacter ruminantium M1]